MERALIDLFKNTNSPFETIVAIFALFLFARFVSYFPIYIKNINKAFSTTVIQLTKSDLIQFT